MPFEVTTPLLLFFIGLVTGAIGCITGGSVLMVAPLLTSFDLPLQSAIATSRVSSFGVISAGLRQFHKAGKVDYRIALQILFWSTLGCIIGAQLMLRMGENELERYVGALMLFLLLFGLLKRRVSFEITLDTIWKKVIGLTLFFFTGLMAGFFGGQAIVASYLLIHFFGLSPSESIGTRKAIGIAVSLAAIIIYASFGTVDWVKACWLLSGSVIGSHISSRWALKRGEETLEWIINLALIALALKMLIS